METPVRRVPTPFRVRSVNVNISQLAWVDLIPCVEESIGIETTMTPNDLSHIERLAPPPAPTQNPPPSHTKSARLCLCWIGAYFSLRRR